MEPFQSTAMERVINEKKQLIKDLTKQIQEAREFINRYYLAQSVRNDFFRDGNKT
jgi:hypothetical protein